eukprot:3210214-Rhodomonas_salina.1
MQETPFPVQIVLKRRLVSEGLRPSRMGPGCACQYPKLHSVRLLFRQHEIPEEQRREERTWEYWRCQCNIWRSKYHATAKMLPAEECVCARPAEHRVILGDFAGDDHDEAEQRTESTGTLEDCMLSAEAVEVLRVASTLCNEVAEAVPTGASGHEEHESGDHEERVEREERGAQ